MIYTVSDFLQIKLQNLKTGDMYEFEFNNWVKITDDSDGWIEIPLKAEKPEDTLQGTLYH